VSGRWPASLAVETALSAGEERRLKAGWTGREACRTMQAWRHNPPDRESTPDSPTRKVNYFFHVFCVMPRFLVLQTG
jgi:hypothetical protein